MFSSLKDRLNSAVTSGLSPKLEEAKKRLTDVGSPSDKLEVELEDKSGQSDTNDLDDELTADSQMDKSSDKEEDQEAEEKPEQTQIEETDNDEAELQDSPFAPPTIPPELQSKLDKLKKYEAKYPELARAYKFQLSKIKELDEVLQNMTPVQAYTDSEGLKDYLKNLASQNELAMSEFKRISTLNQEKEGRLDKLEKSLDEAKQTIAELEVNKETSEAGISSVDGLVEKIKNKLSCLEEGDKNESSYASLIELVGDIRKVLPAGSDPLLQFTKDKEQELEKLNKANLELTNEVEESQGQIHELEVKAFKLEKDIENFTSEISGLKGQIEQSKESQQKSQGFQQKYEGLSKVCLDLTLNDNSKSGIEEKVKNFVKLHNEMTKQLTELKKKDKVNTGLFESLRVSVAEKGKEIEDLSSQLIKAKVDLNKQSLSSPQVTSPPISAAKLTPGSKKKKNKKKGDSSTPIQTSTPINELASPPATPQLEIELISKTKKCNELEASLTQLTDENLGLKEELAQSEKNLSEVKAKILHLESDLELKDSQLKSLFGEKDDLIEKLDSKTNELNQAIGIKAEVEIVCEQLQSDLDRVTSELKAIQKTETELKASNDDYLAQLKDLDAAQEKAKLLEAAEIQNEKMKSERDELTEKLVSTTLQISKHHDEILELKRSTEGLEKEIKSKERALSTAQKEKTKLEKEKKEADKQSNTQQTQIKRLNSELKAKENETEKLTEETTGLREQVKGHDEKVKKLETEIKKVNDELTELSSRSKESGTAKDNLQAQLDKITEELHQIQELKDQASAQATQSKSELTKLQSQLEEAQSRCSVLDQDLDTSKELFKEKASKLDEVRLQHAQLQATSQEQIRQLTAEIKGLTARLNDTELERDRLKSDQADWETQFEQKVSELGSKQEQTTELTSQLEKVNQRLIDAEAKLEELKINLDSKLSELDTANVELAQLKEGQDELDRIKAERDTILEQAKQKELHLRNLNRDLKEEVKRLQRGPNSSMSPPMSPTDRRSLSDLSESEGSTPFNMEYLRNVILKFLMDRERRPQLVTVLSHLLKMSQEDTNKLMGIIHL